MRKVIKETIVYTFDELSEDGKESALDNLRDINVDFDWWNSVYEDAERAGLKITAFDTYHGTIDGSLIDDAETSIDSILEEHGQITDTYTLASEYKIIIEVQRMELEDDADECDELDDIEQEYEYALLQKYLSMLRQEYEYQTSDEGIKETIEANEYEFTEDGSIYR